jgi:hypothetical protein
MFSAFDYMKFFKLNSHVMLVKGVTRLIVKAPF